MCQTCFMSVNIYLIDFLISVKKRV